MSRIFIPGLRRIDRAGIGPRARPSLQHQMMLAGGYGPMTLANSAAFLSATSVSFTCSGANRLLLVALGTSNIASPTFTYNSVGMTLITSITQGDFKEHIYGLVNPASGANTLAHNIGEVNPFAAYAFTNAHSAGWRTATTNGGTSTTASISPASQVGDIVIAVAGCDGGWSGTGGGVNNLFFNEFDASSAWQHNSGYKTGEAGSTTLSWTLSLAPWVIAGVAARWIGN